MPTVERSMLHVEGTDDVHIVRHLLLRHEIDCPIKGEKRPTHDFPPNAPEITPAGDKDAVLAAIETAVPVSNGRSVGFVLDADEEPQDRWRAVAAGSECSDWICRMRSHPMDSLTMLRSSARASACG